MSKIIIIMFVLGFLTVGVGVFVLNDRAVTAISDIAETPLENNSDAESEIDKSQGARPTERYSAQVDRVKVLFEQWDYTRYRLQTNDLVREGSMNSERGFGDDVDATVYVLNWDKPEGEQIRYVRLTAEPGILYVLDGYQNIIRNGRLILE